MSDEQPTANAAGDGDFSTGLRLGLAAALGHSGHAQRDRYDVFGWEKDPDPKEYYGLYLRNPYAYAAVAQKPATTWRDPPTIVDGTHPEDVTPSDDGLTAFERRVRALGTDHDVWSYAHRVDRLAGIGTHGLLVLDLDDTDGPEDFADPPATSDPADADEPTPGEDTEPTPDAGTGLDGLRGFRPYSAVSIDDIEYGEPGADRWGLPETYDIDLRDDPINEDGSPGTDEIIEVHHSRAIDVPARPLDDDETHARPRIEVVLNAVYDIEKALGAAAELAYAGAKQDIHIDFDPEKVDASQVTDNDDELQDWYHDRNPWIRTVGGDVEQIAPPEIVDPTGVIDAELRAYSAATGIPRQLLDGSVAGELASAEQNERDYFGTIAERRHGFATPRIVRAIVDRLVALGRLPAPEGDVDAVGHSYRVEWPDLTELSEADVADLRNQRAQIVERLGMAVPRLRGARAETFVETGDFPERDRDGADGTDGTAVDDTLDESDPAVREQFARGMDMAGAPGEAVADGGTDADRDGETDG